MRRATTVLLLAAMLAGPVGTRAGLIPCAGGRDGDVAAALARIRASMDPCGESGEIDALLDGLERCEAAYRICVRSDAARNLFERPAAKADDVVPGTITWNPGLASELDATCETDPTRPLMRDPVASLVHEIVHAVHDCAGLRAGTLELEAVRVENIYRRAAGLCERGGYGDERLPAHMRPACAGSIAASP